MKLEIRRIENSRLTCGITACWDDDS